MILTDIQAVAARSDYLLRVTLDYLYVPYNNWSMASGQSAAELAVLLAYLDTWPRSRFFISQPVGEFQPCDLCDLRTLLYLMYRANGWCKPPVFGIENPAVNTQVACTSAIGCFLSPDFKNPVTPTFGVNDSSYILSTENGRPLLADNATPLPCFRDWVALGLGNPPGPSVDPYQFNPWAPAPG